MKKRDLYLGGMILIIVLLAFAYPTFFEKITSGSFLGSITSEKLYVPRIGSVWCEETTWNPSDQVSKTWSDSTKTELGLRGELLGVPEIWAKGGHTLLAEYVCSGAYCELENPDTSNFECFESNYFPVYDVYIAGDLKESHKITATGSNKNTWSIIDGDTIRFSEGQTVRINASCVGVSGWFDQASTRAKKIKLNIGVRNKELIRYLDGTKIKDAGTIGCTSQAIQLLALQKTSLSNQIQNGTKINTIVDSGNNIKLADFDFTTKLLTTAGFPFGTHVPVPLNVGQTYEFAYEYKELTAFGNVVTLTNGKEVYIDSVGRNVYYVEKMTNNSGTTINVLGLPYKQKPSCINNEECREQQDARYSCDIKNTFTCIQQANACTVATSQTDCGQPTEYITTGNQPQVVKSSCVNNKCVSVIENIVCNPTKNYPFNNCSEDKQICSNDGSYCFAEVKPETACVTECCLPTDPYHFTKACPTGFDCKTNGGYSGICVDKVIVSVCGDGICSNDEVYSCEADCGEPIKTCPNLWDTYKTITYKEFALWGGDAGTGLFGVFGEKTITESGCFLDQTLVILLVLFLLFFLALIGVFWATRKGKKRGRKR